MWNPVQILDCGPKTKTVFVGTDIKWDYLCIQLTVIEFVIIGMSGLIEEIKKISSKSKSAVIFLLLLFWKPFLTI